jgi:hypothetical protein
MSEQINGARNVDHRSRVRRLWRAASRPRRCRAVALLTALLLAAAAPMLTAGAAWAAPGGPVQATVPMSGLDGPVGLAVDRLGNVFVTDGFTEVPGEGESGSLVELPANGSGQQTVGNPSAPGVAVDFNDNLYMEDPNGVVELPFKIGGAYGVPVTLPFQQLRNPLGLAVDNPGDVFVADAGQAAVLELPHGPGGYSAPIVLPFTGLAGPTDVAVDQSGDVFAADSGNNRVLELPAGSSAPITLPFTGLDDPAHIAVDAAGDLFVTDEDNNRVLEMPAGSSAPVILPFTGLNSPHGVAASPEGDVYVADYGNNRVEELSQYVPTTTAITSASPASPVAGQRVTVNVAVTSAYGSAAGGPVVVSDGGSQSCTAFVNAGTGSCLLTEDAAGPYTLTASFAGFGAFAPSAGTAGLTVDPITVSVQGSQVYGSASPAFTQANNAPPGVTLTGTLSCATVNGGQAIDASLDAGSYTSDGSSCSGLSASTGSAISYDGGTFTVSQAAQSISFTAPATGAVGESAALTATGGGSGTPVVFAVDSSSGTGVCSLSGTNGSTVSYAAAGSCIIDANQAGNADYIPAPQVSGTITVNPGSQAIGFTAPAAGTVGGSAALTAAGGGSGNPVVFSVDASSGAGVCTVSGTNGTTVSYAAAGSCVIDANQAGNASYSAAPQVTQTITVNQAPTFVIGSPPLTAVAGQPYDYTFVASGTPAPAYALAAGAPSWLTVNATTGEVTGTPPSGTTSFSYSVTATNVAGTATAGPFTVTVTTASSNADISAALSCPASLTVGSTGTCTLAVVNAGPAAASKVIAAIALPAALSPVSCSSGCARLANVDAWTLASLASGASAKFTVTVRASRTGTATLLGAAASPSPDPKPLNNITVAQITVKH